MDGGGLALCGTRLADALVPTNWAFSQLCQRAKAPAGYLRTLQPDTAALCLNEGLGKAEDGKSLILAEQPEDDDDVTWMRADTSPSYGRIWDAQVVELVEGIIEASGGVFFNPKEWGGNGSGLYASDRDCFLFLIDGGSIVDGGRTSQNRHHALHRGFFVWNSEVGNATFGLASFFFDEVCGNHGIWGGQQYQELRIRHTPNAPGRFVNEATPMLLDYVQQSAKPLEDLIRKAESYELPMEPDLKKLIEWGTKHGLTGAEVKGAVSYCRREEGVEPATLWHFHHGITAYARDLAFVDARVDLERRAGKLIQLAA
jgi:hypothetical protein